MRARWMPLLLMTATLLAAGPAQAGPPGTWTKVTGLAANDANTAEVGVARTQDGILHVSWYQAGPGLAGTYLHSAISKDARTLTGPNPIATFSRGFNNRSALVAVPGGLEIFFAGLTDGPLDSQMATAFSTNGTAWAVAPGPVSNDSPAGSSPVYVASGIGATLDGDSNPVFTWGDSAPGAGGYHFGLDSESPDLRFGESCCSIDPNVAMDNSSFQVIVTWNLLDDGGGVRARAIAPAGATLTPPNSSSPQNQQRTGITGRFGGAGVYLAYVSGTNQFTGRPAVWRFGDSGARVLSNRTGARSVNIAAAPGGKLWVFWERQDRLYATRSNASATKFGAIVSVAPPKGTDAIYRLAGEASLDPLDLLAHVGRSSGDLATWHMRIRPGLTLATSSRKGRVKFEVTDAGDPVGGALVRLRVKGSTFSGKTGGGGKLTLRVPKAKRGKGRATASAEGYAPAATRVRVK